MKPIPIDLNRLKALQAICGREKAAHAAAAVQLNEVMAASDTLARDVRLAESRVERFGGSENETTLRILERRKKLAEAEIVTASADLEGTKDRLSAANRLRLACESYAQSSQHGKGALHVEQGR